MAAAEARLLAGLSQMPNVQATEPLRAGEAGAGEATQVQWRGSQARWEAEAAQEPAGRRYAFGEVFARGGIGAVRRAEDRKLGRTVAVKELLRFDEGAVQRFAREAEITARLQHPGIVPLYDVGRDGQGQPFLCMKLVDGDTLEQAIAGAEGLAGRLRLLPHLIAASEAVAYAHRHAVIHRDLKPGNILVGEFGETVVIDWGLAKDLSRGTGSEEAAAGELAGTGSDLTQAGSLMGTLRYMPPEQARGLGVEARSDVYALGASLLHVMTGKPPFPGLHGASLLQAVLDGAPRVTEVGLPRGLVAIAEKAMRRAPADRYASAEAFAEDLRRFTAGRVVGAHDYSLGEVARLWLQRQRTVAMVAAGSIVALAVIGGVAVGRIAVARGEAEAGQAAAIEAEALAEQRAAAAETARALADRRSDELRLMQAQSVAASGPTAAIGWLAQLGPGEDLTEAARTIALGARAAGLASRTLRGPAGAVEVASGLADGSIVAKEEAGPVWRWAPGATQGETLAATGRLVVAPGGRDFAVFEDGELTLWRAGEAARTVTTTVTVGWNVELCGGGATLVVHANEAGRSTTTIVDLASGAGSRLGVDEGPKALAGLYLLPSEDGRRFVGLDGERTVVVWDRGATSVQTLRLPEQSASVPGFGADGEVVLVMIGSEVIMEVAGKTMVHRERALLWRPGSAPRIVEAHAAAMFGDAVAFAAYGASGLRIWAEDRATGATRWTRAVAGTRPTTPGTLMASPDGQVLTYIEDQEVLLAGTSGALLTTPAGDRRWPGQGGALLVRQGRVLRTIELLRGAWRSLAPMGSGKLGPIAVAPDGATAARQRGDGRIERIDLASGAATVMPEGCGAWARETTQRPEVADDGRVLLTTYDRACLWSAAGVHEVALPELPLGTSFTPTGVRFSLYEGEPNLVEWDGRGGAPRPIGSTGSMSAMVAVAGGRTLAALQSDGSLRLLGEGGVRELLAAVPGTGKRQGDLALAPDGRTLAVYVRESTELRLADRERGEIGRLRGAPVGGPRDPSPRLRFDASGQAVALLDGGKLSRWSLAQPDAPVSVEVPGVLEIVFAADGARVVALTREGTVLLVDVAGQRAVPLRRGAPDLEAKLGRDAAGGVLLTTGGELLRWADELPAGEELRGWLREMGE